MTARGSPVNQSTNQSQKGFMLVGNRPAIEKGSNFDLSDRAARLIFDSWSMRARRKVLN